MLNIALNTFREIVRNKFLYLILFFAFVFILFSISLWKLTIGDDEKIIVDFGLSMIELFGLVGVLFVWSQLLFKEIEWKTIFLILSKPIKRYEFILGKFFWFSGTIALIILFQSIVFLLVLLLQWIEITPLISWSLWFTFLKLEILLSIVFLFSTFMGNMLTILSALMVYILSHSYSILINLALKTSSIIIIYATQWLQLLFPPLEALNTKDVIGTFDSFHITFFLQNTLYAVVYWIILLYISILIFNKKKFEN